MEASIMKNQRVKKMENGMETGLQSKSSICPPSSAPQLWGVPRMMFPFEAAVLVVAQPSRIGGLALEYDEI